MAKSKVIPVYAGDNMPDDLRLAALDLLRATQKHLERRGVQQFSTAEIMGMAGIALNEVNRELTFGLWKEGDI